MDSQLIIITDQFELTTALCIRNFDASALMVPFRLAPGSILISAFKTSRSSEKKITTIKNLLFLILFCLVAFAFHYIEKGKWFWVFIHILYVPYHCKWISNIIVYLFGRGHILPHPLNLNQCTPSVRQRSFGETDQNLPRPRGQSVPQADHHHQIFSFTSERKDITPNSNKCGVVYKINCPHCTDTYVGETTRALGTRFKEHTRAKPPLTAVGEHSTQHKHQIQMDDVQVIARENHYWNRKICEAIEIRTHKPTLNRDTGYDLPAIYGDLHSLDHPSGGQVTGGQ